MNTPVSRSILAPAGPGAKSEQQLALPLLGVFDRHRNPQLLARFHTLRATACSRKGGVGLSTFTTKLASSLCRPGRRPRASGRTFARQVRRWRPRHFARLGVDRCPGRTLRAEMYRTLPFQTAAFSSAAATLMGFPTSTVWASIGLSFKAMDAVTMTVSLVSSRPPSDASAETMNSYLPAA